MPLGENGVVPLRAVALRRYRRESWLVDDELANDRSAAQSLAGNPSRSRFVAVVALQVGDVVGNYRLLKLIGEGGFGEVYLAENPLIGRRAAVKVLHPALARDDELVRRFLNEARAASAIQHPSIVQVFDAGVTPEGAPYLLMEFLEGQSLQKWLTNVGRLALPRVLAIAGQAGSALSAAHDAGIVHRDLKPENVFLVPDKREPGGELVKILDFGIAKIKGGTGSGGTLRTQSGMIMGSPAYMSPEQCKDSADVDHRTDIYSFATIIYEMLAGKTPYVALSGTELLIMHLTATPAPLGELAKGVPAHVEAAIMRGLARERTQRFDSMEAFVAALRDEAPVPVATRAPPTEALTAEASQPATPPDRTAPLPASTTFSRATGELEAKASDASLLAATKPRRWPAIAVGGIVLVAFVTFLLVRPGHDTAPPATTRTMSAAPKAAKALEPVAPAAEVVPVPGEPATPLVPAIKADAGAAPLATDRRRPTRKPPRATARRTRSVPTTKKGRSEEEWLAH